MYSYFPLPLNNIKLDIISNMLLSQDGNAGCRGNVLLKRMVGSQIILIPKRSPYEKAIKPRMEKMAELLR